MNSRLKYWVLVLVFAGSALLKMVNINTGGPQIMIDDYTLYEGGFLVWFGNAAPQHAYLECWINGFSSIITYLLKCIGSGDFYGVVGLNFVADAYRDFYVSPDAYYWCYRGLMLLIDLWTALIVYKVAGTVLENRLDGFASVLVCVLYLLSYNTVWCNLVGRPDTLVSFTGAVGIFWYLKSDYGRRLPYLLGAAAFLGMAAGLKLHGAFFAIFAAMDMLRARGVKDGIRSAVGLALVSLFLFAVSDGTILFDPLKYVKARMLTYGHDISPWLKMGQQFLTILRGSGWVAIPVTLFCLILKRWRQWNGEDDRIKSILFMSLCWVILFASIRQLRAYWMVPALPLIYISVGYALSTISHKRYSMAVAAALSLVLFFQSADETRLILSGNQNELRRWVGQNIKREEAFLILGYSVLRIPRNTDCINRVRFEIEEGLRSAIERNVPFTYRHVLNWEETSMLRLFDMLNFRSEAGHEFYCYYEHSPEFLVRLLSEGRVRYVILEDGFSLKSIGDLGELVSNRFAPLVEVKGEGGRGYGMLYKVLRWKDE